VSDELKLRDYQEDAITAVFKAWSEDMTRPAIVLPPGAGKTVVFSALIKKSRRAQEHPAGPMRVYPGVGRRVIVLVHRDELADQAMAKIHSVAPELTVGKVKASVRQVNADVMVCSVQTLARGTAVKQIKVSEAFHGPVGLIITDECHHAAAPSYRQVFAQFPDALQLGVTATMARGDGGGLGDVWEEVVYSRSILWMMSRGYLSPVTTRQIQLKELDMSGVKTTRGDYAAEDLGRAMIEAEADRAIPRAYKEHAGNRPGIIFTPTVATAQATADAMTLAGTRPRSCPARRRRRSATGSTTTSGTGAFRSWSTAWCSRRGSTRRGQRWPSSRAPPSPRPSTRRWSAVSCACGRARNRRSCWTLWGRRPTRSKP